MAADLEIQALILFSGDNRQGVKEQSSIPARQGRFMSTASALEYLNSVLAGKLV